MSDSVSLPERLADTVTIRFARRPDGGLRVVCDELPGLVLSHADHALVLTDLVPAIETLVFARLTAAESAREAAIVERDQFRSALAHMRDDYAGLVGIDQRAAEYLDERDAALARAERAEKALEPFATFGANNVDEHGWNGREQNQTIYGLTSFGVDLGLERTRG